MAVVWGYTYNMALAQREDGTWGVLDQTLDGNRIVLYGAGDALHGGWSSNPEGNADELSEMKDKLTTFMTNVGNVHTHVNIDAGDRTGTAAGILYLKPRTEDWYYQASQVGVAQKKLLHNLHQWHLYPLDDRPHDWEDPKKVTNIVMDDDAIQLTCGAEHPITVSNGAEIYSVLVEKKMERANTITQVGRHNGTAWERPARYLTVATNDNLATKMTNRNALEKQVCAELGIKHHWVKIGDGEPVYTEILTDVAMILRNIPQGKTVLVHCSAGMGRSKIIALLWYLVCAKQEPNKDAAMQWIQNASHNYREITKLLEESDQAQGTLGVGEVHWNSAFDGVWFKDGQTVWQKLVAASNPEARGSKTANLNANFQDWCVL